MFWISRVPDADMLSVYFARSAYASVAASLQAWPDAFVDYDRFGRISAVHLHEVSRTLASGGDTVALDVLLPEDEVIVSFVPPDALFPDNDDDDGASTAAAAAAWDPADGEPRIWMQRSATETDPTRFSARVRALCIPRASESIVAREEPVRRIDGDRCLE